MKEFDDRFVDLNTHGNPFVMHIPRDMNEEEIGLYVSGAKIEYVFPEEKK